MDFDPETDEIIANARADFHAGRITYRQLLDVYESCARAEAERTLDNI